MLTVSLWVLQGGHGWIVELDPGWNTGYALSRVPLLA